jgi:hypothetical protein
MAAQASALKSLQNGIKAYSSDIKADQDRLARDLGDVGRRFVDGGTWVQALTTAIGDDFLEDSALGPCCAIVEIRMDVSFKAGGIQSDPSLITLVFAKAILENQTGNAEAAEQAVQGVLDGWTTLMAKTAAVVSDLNDAGKDQYLNVLAQADLQTAKTQWRQLADFASTLVPLG